MNTGQKKPTQSDLVAKLTLALDRKAAAQEEMEEGAALLIASNHLFDAQSAADTSKGDSGIAIMNMEGQNIVENAKSMIADLNIELSELEKQLLSMGIEVLDIDTKLPLGPNQTNYNIVYQQRRRAALDKFSRR